MDMAEKILMACRMLIEQRGFRGFTVDDLALNAGVSKRTIYKYYRSKDEIIEKVVEVFLTKMQEEVNKLINGNEKLPDIPNIMLKNLIKHGRFIIMPNSLEDLKLYYPHIWQKIDNFRIEQMRKLIEKALNECNIVEIKEVNPTIISTALAAAVQAVLNPIFILDNNIGFEDAANQLGKLFSVIFKSIKCET
ncbi:TetR/AcrR family transcriptional regulator [Thermosyntropha sp.]|uniref:TetR/AcrR family transcriptional regulator n=1 Tax=Thermosyntropha sp. TaxID=2740820 RepID=UPI0025D18150|nr:TetR/AcrR family transcriptional regulator [Thermosyntropha sp.]MBO8158734.1 TetR/AcrR family transcriptional regulator [Thermosyntropha sp.]